MKEQKIKPKKKGFRFVCTVLHRDLGYLFAGIVLIYAISGIAMNHNKSFNPNFSVENIAFSLPTGVASSYSDVGEKDIDQIFALADCPRSQYTKHFKDGEGRLKILVKGGSTIVADLSKRTADYEKVSPRPVLGPMVKLHYNPGRWWTFFADVFAVALVLITITGLFIIKGKNGITRRGIVLFAIGILFPLAFLLL